jgi:hypothetical protein
LSYAGSIEGTGLNLSREGNAMQCVSHQLTGKLTSFLFSYPDVLNQIDK